MRQQSGFALLLFATLLTQSVVCVSQVLQQSPAGGTAPNPPPEHPPECSIKATYAYPKRECTITYYREKPFVTNAYTVPPKTTIYLRIIRQRPFEAPTTKITTTQLPPLDLFGSIVKNFASPLSLLTIKSGVGKALDTNTPQGAIEHDELSLKNRLDDTNAVFDHAKASVSCLQTGRTVARDLTCATIGIDSKNEQAMNVALQSTTEELAYAAQQAVPERTELAPILAKIHARLAVCKTMPTDTPDQQKQQNECVAEMQRAQRNIFDLGLGMDDSSATQKSLTALYDNIRAIGYGNAASDTLFSYVMEADHSDVVKTSVVDALTKTSTDIASTTINAQYSRFALSTGVMLSTLKNQTFANAPIIVNGKPVLDGSGKALTQVVVNSTRPSVVFPLVLLSYRAHSFSKHCGGNCSFLLSGGVGANLSSKTADFALGPSLQIGTVLISPIFHYGRQTQLTNGVKLGQQLGSSPPTLPANYFWAPAFGLSIGYVIPIGALGSSK
jgi:hypothetical protein